MNFISVVIMEDNMFEVIWKVKITGNRIAIPLIVQFMYCIHHCIKCTCSMITGYLEYVEIKCQLDAT